MAFYLPKGWVTHFEKCQCLDFLNFLLLKRRKAFFPLEYRKRHFPGLCCLKKKVGEMVIFVPKAWVKRFGKMSIFELFELLVFIAQKSVFSFQNIGKGLFLWLYCLKKKLDKWPFLDETDGLTPLEKCQFLDFLNFLVLQPRKPFFPFRIS